MTTYIPTYIKIFLYEVFQNFKIVKIKKKKKNNKKKKKKKKK